MNNIHDTMRMLRPIIAAGKFHPMILKGDVSSAVACLMDAHLKEKLHIPTDFGPDARFTLLLVHQNVELEIRMKTYREAIRAKTRMLDYVYIRIREKDISSLAARNYGARHSMDFSVRSLGWGFDSYANNLGSDIEQNLPVVNEHKLIEAMVYDALHATNMTDEAIMALWHKEVSAYYAIRLAELQAALPNVLNKLKKEEVQYEQRNASAEY